MKVSLSAVKKFTDVDISVDVLVAKIGAQLGAVEAVYQSGAKYENIVVARVVSYVSHPNADKLSVCKIDDGGVVNNVVRDEKGLVQVVCGAPNAREGLTVAWIPPGATVPSTYWKDPFVLEAREIRGEVSNGMLASPSELAIGESHDGILEIEEDVNPGTPFKTLYDLDDVTIEIENKMFTHRPDCFGILGIAREIAGIQQEPFKSPDWYLNPDAISQQTAGEELPFEVHNELPELTPRFMAVAMSNVQIGPSPTWLQALLTRVNIKPINNVVDITNYLSYITAQPLHAYDYDKVKARSGGEAKLVVRYPRKGESLKLLNGKTIEPRAEAIMIATDKELIGIGGVMGGSGTEVDENTKNIILESANFDLYSIRRTSMTHGLFTDAVTRFSKGQSPAQNDKVLAEAVRQLAEISNATVASEVIDDKHFDERPKIVQVSADFINQRLGLDVATQSIVTLLENVEFEVKVDGNNLTVEAPFWRTDIEIPEDVVEEVGRLYGYDKLPLELPKRSTTPVAQDPQLAFKQKLRSALAGFGANETLNYSFVPGKLLEATGQNPDVAYKITNALSPDLQYYRLSITPSLLEKVHPNIKSGHDEFAIFEIGKVHSKTETDKDGLPKELSRLACAYAANDKLNLPGAAYYHAKTYLSLITDLEIVPFDEKLLNGHELSLQMIAPFDRERSGLIWNGQYVAGIVGEYSQSAIKRLKLPNYSAGFEIFMSALEKAEAKPSYQPLSRFPSVHQDICLQVSNDVTYGELSKALDEALTSKVLQGETVSWQPIDIYTSEELGNEKRITYRVTLTSYERTLTDDSLTKLLDSVADTLTKSHSAKRI